MQIIRCTLQLQLLKSLPCFSQQAFLFLRKNAPELIVSFFFHLKLKGYDDLTAINLHVTIVLLAK